MAYVTPKIKILYAVQATGNGHIARAMQLMPYLEKYGEVDVFLSGSNSNLKAALPVKYRSNGLSLFYGNRGGLDYMKIWKQLDVRQLWKEANQLPVEQYDIVINDFECITSLACKLKQIPSINFGHQASFISPNTPKPLQKDMLGEWVLTHYATATNYIGLHFENYDDFIFSPIIKQQILEATPSNKGHVSVYLSHYSDEVVIAALQKCKDIPFHLFSKKATAIEQKRNITLMPISNDGFASSMIDAAGIITGAGFETPAEALYLGKKLLCLPIKGQYEQLCNAAALEKFRVPIINTIDEHFTATIYKWLSSLAPKPLTLQQSTNEIVGMVMEKGIVRKTAPRTENDFYLLYPDELSFA
ncbi:glycosyltransferase family protein [Parasediminibacterium sp. JCM 36343]|uniref:glycosyltransferase family protein n=1 Tax=Parasediminibacterium sp. JCM 36343 TaxID=3374279 RepID=UPI00397C0DCC